MSKAGPLGPRPTKLELWREAAMPAGTGPERGSPQRPNRETQGWSKTGATAEADAADAGGVDPTVRAGGGLRSAPLNTNNNAGTSLLDSRSSTQNRRGELFTAEKPPVTKSMEGPEPPAWLKSRVGLLCEGGPSAVSLASVGACRGESASASEWSSPGAQNNGWSTMSSGGAVLGGGNDESSALALGFTRVPWAISDEGSEGAQSARSVSLDASDSRPIKGAVERHAADAMRATRKPKVRKARYHRRKRGRLQPRNGGGGGRETTAAPTAQPFSKTDVPLLRGDRVERGRGMAQHPTDDDVSNSSGTRKPQPELYDVWIPQHYFQGKGLPMLKRVRGEVELQPQRSSRPKATKATGENKTEGEAPTEKPPNQGVDSFSRDRHHLALRQQQQKHAAATDKRCAIHYVGGPEDFVKDDAAPQPQAPLRAGSPGAGTTSTCPADGERLGAFFTDFADDSEEVAAEEKPWSVVDDDDDDDFNRGGGFWNDDIRGGTSVLVDDAAVVATDGGGGFVGGEQDEQDGEQAGRASGQDDDEYFDYAKRFSWRTAAEVVKQAETEAEGWLEEERRGRQRGIGNGCRNSGATEVSRGFTSSCQARILLIRTPIRFDMFVCTFISVIFCLGFTGKSFSRVMLFVQPYNIVTPSCFSAAAERFS